MWKCIHLQYFFHLTNVLPRELFVISMWRHFANSCFKSFKNAVQSQEFGFRFLPMVEQPVMNPWVKVEWAGFEAAEEHVHWEHRSKPSPFPLGFAIVPE